MQDGDLGPSPKPMINSTVGGYMSVPVSVAAFRAALNS